MKTLQSIIIVLSIALSPLAYSADITKSEACPEYLNVDVRRLHSTQIINLCDFYRPGKPIVVVNTASHCGFTPQFKGLEALHQKYKDQELTVLGFPSNDFKQEEAEELGTAEVCYKNYGVTFPMFEHVYVKGEKAHTLFAHLASETKEPQWNFNKYLLDDKKIQHFSSSVTPLKSDLEKAIVKSF